MVKVNGKVFYDQEFSEENLLPLFLLGGSIINCFIIIFIIIIKN